MGMITVNTGRGGFVMIDRIIRVDSGSIVTEKRFGNEDLQVHSPIEVMAQTGALHVRFLNDFSQHAFLLTVDHYHSERPLPEPGNYRVTGRLASRSSQAFAHELRLENEAGAFASGRFLFALRPYGGGFDRERLETHYRKVFACLKNAI